MEDCEMRVFGSEKNLQKIVECLKAKYSENNVIVSGLSRNTRPPREGDFRCYITVRFSDDKK